MPKPSIAILTGGTSSERMIALASAKNIRGLLSTRYRVRVFDLPKQLPAFLSARRTFKVAIPVFHGKGGEDGTIQGFLKTLGIPFLFSDVEAHAIAMNKAFTKDIMKQAGVRTAPYAVYAKRDISRIRYPGKCVIKPMDGGSSIGVAIAKTKQEFTKGLRGAFSHSDSVLIETFISGKEFTVAVIESGRKTTALPVIEIRPKTAFFDFASKYDASLVEELCPAPIKKTLSKKLQDAAVRVHQLLGAKHLTRSDFIVDAKGRIWFLEINTIPGQTLNSLVPKAMRAGGIDMEKQFSEWIEKV